VLQRMAVPYLRTIVLSHKHIIDMHQVLQQHPPRAPLSLSLSLSLSHTHTPYILNNTSITPSSKFRAPRNVSYARMPHATMFHMRASICARPLCSPAPASQNGLRRARSSLQAPLDVPRISARASAAAALATCSFCSSAGSAPLLVHARPRPPCLAADTAATGCAVMPACASALAAPAWT
jgi:hypothetical protein